MEGWGILKAMSKSSAEYNNLINLEVYKHIIENSECLDVGCWNGNLGYKLIKDKNCVVDGIDINKEGLLKAKQRGYRHTYNINFNNDKWSISSINKNYDYIIFSDVLEHLIDPSRTLLNLKTKLKSNGRAVISIPNSVFMLQRIEYLLGKFTYNVGFSPDYTHVRFFTKKSIISLVENSGYKITNVYGYSEVKNKFFILKPLAKIFPSLFAIEFIVIAENKP